MHYIALSIPEIPEAQNVKNQKHWGRRHAEACQWETNVWAEMKSKKIPIPKKPLERVQISLVRHSWRMLDFDGVVGSLKPVVDALVKLKILKDDSWTVTGPWFVDQRFRAKKDGPLLEIIVEEISHE